MTDNHRMPSHITRVPSLVQVEHVPDRLLRFRHHRIMPGIYNLVRTLKSTPLSRNNLVDRVPTLRAENVRTLHTVKILREGYRLVRQRFRPRSPFGQHPTPIRALDVLSDHVKDFLRKRNSGTAWR